MLVKIEGIVTNKKSYIKNQGTEKQQTVFSMQLLQQIPGKPATLVEVNVVQKTYTSCEEMKPVPKPIDATITLWSKDGRSGAIVNEVEPYVPK